MRLERWFGAAILFLNGWLLALPVTNVPLPVWLTPIQVVHGVFLHEAMLMAYLAFAFIVRGARLSLPARIDAIIAGLIAGLGVLNMISAAANFNPVREQFSAGRYFLLAFYFLAAASWTRKNGPTFVLRNFLFGLVCSGAINLYYTFTINYLMLGTLPFLLGQSGPGGALGLGVVLSARLMLERQTRRDTFVAVASGIVGVIAASISFSKLGMLMAAAGIIGWLFVMWRDITTPRLRKWYAIILIPVIVALSVNREGLQRYVDGVSRFVELKFKNVKNRSTEARAQYFLITAEIVANHPFLGVGTGGFYEAATETRAYRSRRSAREDAGAGERGESNPHSAFLYQAASTGLPGLLTSASLFTLAMAVMGKALIKRGLSGIGLWMCLGAAYVVHGLTLPTMFNTSVLYLPLAAAIGSWVWASGRGRRPAQARRILPPGTSYGAAR